ncbi:hypothetical protein TNIN_143031 [Trichonephila inaurata madagascariensis]|uniref:DDE-1 domain-containing protein n=1 Tax=Trichonephila inaurata madagascariensis TaxID=2747483 RepID=A0A8X6K299_9ARAC|nr:hypothetical protein TNIN_143031 [Trichonephila inaurata madagascariensis]
MKLNHFVFSPENPRALKNIHKEQTASNVEIESESMGHAGCFQRWLFKVCAPSIKDYLDTNDLQLKALLLLDNAPEHPKDLKDHLLTDFP